MSADPNPRQSASQPEPVLVRVAPEILALLKSGDVEPVVILGVEDAGDGTHDMILRSVREGAPHDGFYADAKLAEVWRLALTEIATRPVVERNPDGEDQAAHTMQLIAREALGMNHA